MNNNKLEKLKFIKRFFFFTLALVLTNCQNDENLTKQEQSRIKTVSIEDAKAFLTKSSNSPSAKLASSKISDLEFDKATLEKLNGSDQLLTVIPFSTNNEVRNDRVLITKIDDEIRSVIFSMQPDENSVKDSFSGKMFIYSLEGDFINGYRAKDGVITTQFVKSNATTSSTSKTIDGGELKEVVIGPKKFVNATNWDAIWGSGGSSIGYAPVGGVSGVTWDATAGGGAGSPSSPAASTPCDQMKKLIDTSKTDNMRAKIDELKAKVNSATNNNEIGVEVKKQMNKDGITFTNVYTSVVSADEFSVPLTVGTSYIGGAHTHPDGGYSMYSFMDVKFLLDAYNATSSVRKEDVFFMMIAKDKTTGVANTYNLKVNDIAKLQKEVDAVWNSTEYTGKTDAEKIKLIRDKQSLKYFDSNGELEKSFLQQFGAFGVTLYKADPDLTKWSNIDFDPTSNILTVKPTPCN